MKGVKAERDRMKVEWSQKEGDRTCQGEGICTQRERRRV
jgi:hypothetical protein